MRRLTASFITIAFTVLAVTGCGPGKPVFNEFYLPGAVPGAPEKRIDLTGYAATRIAKGQLSDLRAEPASLYWIEDDDLLISILSEDRQNPLHTFLISYRAGRIKALEGAEKDALLSRTGNKFVGEKKGNALAEFGKALFQLTIAVITRGGNGGGGGVGGGEQFHGTLQLNGYVLDVDAALTPGEKTWSLFTSYYTCQYKLKNRQTGQTVGGKTKIEKFGKEKESLENWLRSWRISREGRYYLAGDTATFIDNEYGGDTLIENYPFAALDISPNGRRIALLRIAEDEETNRVHYWLEFYPFEYR